MFDVSVFRALTMMIVISSADFRRLSASSQRELLDLLSFNALDQQPREDETSLPFEDFDSVYNESQWPPQSSLNSEAGLFRSVISPESSLALQQEVVESVRKKVQRRPQIICIRATCVA